MLATKRLFPICPVCENRGLVCVGDDDLDFPCPRCNCWCSICLDQPLGERTPSIGVLLAAVRCAGDELELFEGYLCDEHKQFLGYVGIAPAMVGRFKPGDAFIAMQTIRKPRAFVELYGYAEAANWRELEEEAFRAVATPHYSPYGRYGEYPCPPELAQRAVAAKWVTWQVSEIRNRRVLFSRAWLTTWAIEPRA